MVKTQKRIHCQGTTTIEAALIFPLLLLLTFGVIEYGWLFLKAQQITNAARHGARIAIRPDVESNQVLSYINDLLTNAGIVPADCTIILSPTEVSSAAMGSAVNVYIKAQCANMYIVNAAFLPKPTQIQASVTMAKEGP